MLDDGASDWEGVKEVVGVILFGEPELPSAKPGRLSDLGGLFKGWILKVRHVINLWRACVRVNIQNKSAHRAFFSFSLCTYMYE